MKTNIFQPKDRGDRIEECDVSDYADYDCFVGISHYYDQADRTDTGCEGCGTASYGSCINHFVLSHDDSGYQ